MLDGFPRNLAQAEALDGMLAEIGRGLDAVLFFDLSDELAVERIRGRALDEGRDDDTPEAIARRLAIYHEQTEPVVERYRATGKLVPLHAARSIEEVSTEIEAALDLLEDGAARTARASFSSHCGRPRQRPLRDRCDSGSALADPGSAEDRA